MCSLEAKDPERVSAGVEPPRGVRAGSVLLWLPLLLPVLQAAAGRTLQTAALQTGEYSQLWGKLQTLPDAAVRKELSDAVTKCFKSRW